MSLASHSVLIITDRPQSVATFRACLSQIGIKEVFAAHSFREVLETASKECPHLFIFDSDLPDGSAISLLKKLRAGTFFEKTPVIMIRKPTKEELVEIVKLKVTAILAKPVETNALMEKCKAIFGALGHLSPYGFKGTDIPGGHTTTFRFNAAIVGRDENHLICQSSLSLVDGGAFLISPTDTALAPLMAISSGSVKAGDKESNLFALGNIMGKGRTWVSQMAPLKPAVTLPRKVLVYENSKDRAEQLKEILNFHEIDCETVDTMQRLAQRFSGNPDDYKVVYLCETPVGAIAIPWDKAITAIPEPKRPSQVIATSAAALKARPDINWLRKPFTVDQLIENIEVALTQRGNAAAPQGQMWDKSAAKEIPCNYLVKGQIISVDETGGVLELEAPATANAQMFIDHPLFKTNEKIHQVRITYCTPSAVNSKAWHARFSMIDAGMSRGTFWRALRIQFAPKPAEAAAPTATAS